MAKHSLEDLFEKNEPEYKKYIVCHIHPRTFTSSFWRKNYFVRDEYGFPSKFVGRVGRLYIKHSLENYECVLNETPKVRIINGKLMRLCKNCHQYFEDGEKKRCKGSLYEKSLWRKRALDTAMRRGYFLK